MACVCGVRARVRNRGAHLVQPYRCAGLVQQYAVVALQRQPAAARGRGALHCRGNRLLQRVQRQEHLLHGAPEARKLRLARARDRHVNLRVHDCVGRLNLRCTPHVVDPAVCAVRDA